MRCNEAREIILGGYLDGELDAKTLCETELHLASCAGCRAFKETVVEKAVEPFKNAVVAVPPRELWYKVKTRIEDSIRDENYFDLGAIASFFAPKWANIAVLASMILFTSLAGNYVAHNIWVKQSQQGAVAVSEETDTLSLAYLNDIPGEQAQKVYNNIIGG